MLLIALQIGFSSIVAAQEIIVDAKKVDTVKIDEGAKKKDFRPRTATLLSTALPGLGQVYNKRIWKVPILYVLGTAVGIFIYDNSKLYKEFKGIYLQMAEKNLPTSPTLTVTDIYNTTYQLDGATLENIKFYKDKTERQRDLNYIAMAGLYILNIIDANVDAHLRDFEINENLSLHWQPEYKFMPQTNIPYYGVALQLSLHHTGRSKQNFDTKR